MRRYSQPLLDFLGNGGKLQKRTSIHWYSYFGKRFGPGRRTSARLPASYFGSLHCSSRPMVGWGRDDVKIEDAKMKKSEDWEVSKGRPIPNHKLKSFIHMFFFLTFSWFFFTSQIIGLFHIPTWPTLWRSTNALTHELQHKSVRERPLRPPSLDDK